MKVTKPWFKVLSPQRDDPSLTRLIELAGRVCYKSEDKISEGSDQKLLAHLKNLNHESVLEHSSITVHFCTDRGVTHELVRHRLCAFSQESTRYCNYGKDKFGGEITVIEPPFWEPGSNQYQVWFNQCAEAETTYLKLLEMESNAQEARTVLPNSLKTEIIVTANAREWRHILKLRTSAAAHPQIRQIMVPLAHHLASRWPALFGEFRNTKHACPAEDLT